MKLNGKRSKPWFVATILAILFCQYGCTSNEMNDEAHKIEDLIVNADFEKKIHFDENNPTWKTYSWEAESSSYEWEEESGRNRSNCVCLSSGELGNDVALVQELTLEGDKVYELSAWVKTENIVGGRGANICLFGTWQSSDPILGTNDWQKVSLIFVAPESGKVKIGCRIGFWGGVCNGKAWFDDLTIREADMFEQTSAHFRLRLKNKDVSEVNQKTIREWLNNLDLAYDTYYELIGEYPFDGKIITIFSVDTYPGGNAVPGNPILWHQPNVLPALLNIQNERDWSFRILNQISYNFASHIGFNYKANWNWDENLFAALRMFYVVETLNASVKIGKTYKGSYLKNYYKSFAWHNYDQTIRIGNTENASDAVIYTIIRIKEQIGWEAFKKTFQYLYHSETSFTSRWQKFNFFLDKLSDYSGKNVRMTFLEGELETIKKAMDKQDENE